MSKLGILTKLKQNTPLLLVQGQDAIPFLNGLVTIRMLPIAGKKNQHTITNSDSVSKLHEDQIDMSKGGLLHCDESIPWDSPESAYKLGVRRDGRYGLMMKSNGRVLSDFFIYPTPFIDNSLSNGFLVEFLAPNKLKQILMMLKLHKLNAKVDFKQVNCDVWEYEDTTNLKYENLDLIMDKYLNNKVSKSNDEANTYAELLLEESSLINSSAKDNILGFAIDERNAFQGYRFITNTDSKINPESLITLKDISIGSPTEYRIKRLENGIVEAGDLPSSKSDSTLPFEMNLDWMCGINSDKGCYIGQELTLRAWTSNSIPKRILPLKLDEPLPNDDIEGWVVKGTNMVNETPKPVSSPSSSPFGETSKTIKPRRDKSIIGELITTSDDVSLCSIRKDYFDYDYVMEGKMPDYINKPVWLHKDGRVIKATIQGNVWV